MEFVKLFSMKEIINFLMHINEPAKKIIKFFRETKETIVNVEEVAEEGRAVITRINEDSKKVMTYAQQICQWVNPNPTYGSWCFEAPNYCQNFKTERFHCNKWYVARPVYEKVIQDSLYTKKLTVVHGPNGLGKTELGDHQACTGRYDHIWKIPSVGEHSIRYAYKDLLTAHEVDVKENVSWDALKQQVNDLIAPCGGNWLMLYDRFEGHHPKEILMDVPWKQKNSGGWDVLVTSTELIKGVVKNIAVGPFEPTEALAYYENWANEVAGSNTYFQSASMEDRKLLADKLGNHPFLFTQALWIMLLRTATIPQFLEGSQSFFSQLIAELSDVKGYLKSYDRSVEVMIKMTFEALQQKTSDVITHGLAERAKLALALLKVIYYLDYQDMEGTLLRDAIQRQLTPKSIAKPEEVIKLLEDMRLLHILAGTDKTNPHYRMIDINHDGIAEHLITDIQQQSAAWESAAKLLALSSITTPKESIKHVRVLMQALPNIELLEGASPLSYFSMTKLLFSLRYDPPTPFLVEQPYEASSPSVVSAREDLEFWRKGVSSKVSLPSIEVMLEGCQKNTAFYEAIGQGKSDRALKIYIECGKVLAAHYHPTATSYFSILLSPSTLLAEKGTASDYVEVARYFIRWFAVEQADAYLRQYEALPALSEDLHLLPPCWEWLVYQGTDEEWAIYNQQYTIPPGASKQFYRGFLYQQWYIRSGEHREDAIEHLNQAKEKLSPCMIASKVRIAQTDLMLAELYSVTERPELKKVLDHVTNATIVVNQLSANEISATLAKDLKKQWHMVLGGVSLLEENLSEAREHFGLALSYTESLGEVLRFQAIATIEYEEKGRAQENGIMRQEALSSVKKALKTAPAGDLYCLQLLQCAVQDGDMLPVGTPHGVYYDCNRAFVDNTIPADWLDQYAPLEQTCLRKYPVHTEL